MKKFSQMKVNREFKKALERTRLKRIENKVDKKFRSFREMTDMMMKTDNIKKVLTEMEEIPKKEDMDSWKSGKL